MLIDQTRDCPEWCEAQHKTEKTGSHAKRDRLVMMSGVGVLFSNTYYESSSGSRAWVITGVLGEIRFIFDGSKPDHEVKARYEKVFSMYQEVAGERAATMTAMAQAAIDR